MSKEGRKGERGDSLPVLADDGVKFVSARVLCELWDGDGSGRVGLDASVGDGPREPGDDVVWRVSEGHREVGW